MITPVIPPHISINGTGYDALEAQYRAAWHAVRSAKAAMQNAMPHGRDYQHRHMDGFGLDMLANLARARHSEETRKLAQIEDYLESLLGKIVEQRPTPIERSR